MLERSLQPSQLKLDSHSREELQRVWEQQRRVSQPKLGEL